MTWQAWRAVCTASIALLAAGCGGPANSGGDQSSGPKSQAGASTRPVVFVGFDASEPALNAMSQGKIQGIVLQSPFKMGMLGVKTMVQHLEKQPVEARVPTGEFLVTPENLTDPQVVERVHPPKVDNTTGSLSGGKSKKWRVMMIPKGSTHEFWKTVHAGALQAALDLGNVEVIWQAPQKEDDRVQQIQLVQSAIAAGVDGIVLAPLDARALKQPVEAAVDKGISVVIIDSALESTKTVSYVATDNYNGGVLAAKRLGEVLGGEGRIILLRYQVGSESTDQREKGFTDTIAKEFPKITYLSDTEYAGATQESAQLKSQSLVTRFRGKIDGVFAPNETSTVGMLRALEAAGLLTERR
ncbi:MAG: substrate-binding domain-containing protein [Paludisphaera borealis]|uniref:substrate-binding domain-containing protein n=1 Tax=Paludisphaera borealis TaxID=1387353 RepID=UPI0028437453|nr:substrate-binding domain-containing protein [Paludisphaera borealis]MDR3619026.1 substrate-binding domain-containing protein [Paludisphaera borealis]